MKKLFLTVIILALIIVALYQIQAAGKTINLSVDFKFNNEDDNRLCSISSSKYRVLEPSLTAAPVAGESGILSKRYSTSSLLRV